MRRNPWRFWSKPMEESETDVPAVHSKRERRRASEYVVPTLSATALAMFGAAVTAGYQAGARDSTLKQEIMQQVSAQFVTKETSENRSTLLASDVAEVRRTLAEVKELARGIPRIDARLEMLERQVRDK